MQYGILYSNSVSTHPARVTFPLLVIFERGLFDRIHVNPVAAGLYDVHRFPKKQLCQLFIIGFAGVRKRLIGAKIGNRDDHDRFLDSQDGASCKKQQDEADPENAFHTLNISWFNTGENEKNVRKKFCGEAL